MSMSLKQKEKIITEWDNISVNEFAIEFGVSKSSIYNFAYKIRKLTKGKACPLRTAGTNEIEQMLTKLGYEIETNQKEDTEDEEVISFLLFEENQRSKLIDITQKRKVSIYEYLRNIVEKAIDEENK